MAVGWCLAHHALTGARRYAQPSRWSPGTLTALTQAGRLLVACGVSPAAYAAHRWRELVAWQGVPPKGPTAVYGVRWIQPSSDKVRAYQQQLESRLVPLGPAGQQLVHTRSRVDATLREQRPTTPEQAQAILESLAPDWHDQLIRATTEQTMALDDLIARVKRTEWVWG
jgi:hypothetical protein